MQKSEIGRSVVSTQLGSAVITASDCQRTGGVLQGTVSNAAVRAWDKFVSLRALIKKTT
jgi:hypothetical protein